MVLGMVPNHTIATIETGGRARSSCGRVHALNGRPSVMKVMMGYLMELPGSEMTSMQVHSAGKKA
jgi:hypothetical protein